MAKIVEDKKITINLKGNDTYDICRLIGPLSSMFEEHFKHFKFEEIDEDLKLIKLKQPKIIEVMSINTSNDYILYNHKEKILRIIRNIDEKLNLITTSLPLYVPKRSIEENLVSMSHWNASTLVKINLIITHKIKNSDWYLCKMDKIINGVLTDKEKLEIELKKCEYLKEPFSSTSNFKLLFSNEENLNEIDFKIEAIAKYAKVSLFPASYKVEMTSFFKRYLNKVFNKLDETNEEIDRDKLINSLLNNIKLISKFSRRDFSLFTGIRYFSRERYSNYPELFDSLIDSNLIKRFLSNERYFNFKHYITYDLVTLNHPLSDTKEIALRELLDPDLKDKINDDNLFFKIVEEELLENFYCTYGFNKYRKFNELFGSRMDIFNIFMKSINDHLGMDRFTLKTFKTEFNDLKKKNNLDLSKYPKIKRFIVTSNI